MAGIKFTNPSLTETVDIYSDPSDRVGRVVIASFAPGETKYIDEINLMPALDTYEQFQLALKGKLTITESDLDNLSAIEYAQFLAEGLGVKYFYSTNNINSGKAVAYDEENGTVKLVSANGDKPVGILNASALNGHYVRVKVSGLTTALLSSDVSVGDSLLVKTDGSVYAATNAVNQNKWSIGVANNNALSGELITFVINIILL